MEQIFNTWWGYKMIPTMQGDHTSKRGDRKEITRAQVEIANIIQMYGGVEAVRKVGTRKSGKIMVRRNICLRLSSFEEEETK